MEKLKSVTVSFTLKSNSPIKMDKWIDGNQPKNDEGYRNQAKEKCYRNDKGIIVIPANAIKASMKLASSEIGKKMEGKKNRQTIQSAIFIEDDLSLGKKEPDEIVKDIVTRKGTGDKVTRVPTYRPLIKEWKAQGIMHLFGVPEIFVKECLELAGFRYGLLSHRPEFGRFTVSEWKVV